MPKVGCLNAVCDIGQVVQTGSDSKTALRQVLIIRVLVDDLEENALCVTVGVAL